MCVFIASLGGIFNLFLGCSFMSGIEVLYYFTLRLFLRLRLDHVEQSTQAKRQPEVAIVGRLFPYRNIGRVGPMPVYTTATRRFL
jgi:hypothetical protein